MAAALALGADLLIAEAKQRARRRRLRALLAAIVVVAAAAFATTHELRSSANSLGICATVPSGWQEKMVNDSQLNPPAVVMTNFRFGRMEDFYGFTDRFAWPANGVTVAVSNWGPANTPRIQGGPLRVTRSSFGGLEGSPRPSGEVAIRSNGRILNAYVAVGKLTPTTIALVNQALAGVRTCSA